MEFALLDVIFDGSCLRLWTEERAFNRRRLDCHDWETRIFLRADIVGGILLVGAKSSFFFAVDRLRWWS